MLRIYDLNNWVRVCIETDHSGLIIRNLYSETQASPVPTIWVADGKGGNELRRSLYPGYKGNREPVAESIYQSIDLLKQVVRQSKAFFVEIPGYEADDVIAAIAKRYRECLIFSTDGDLIQLSVDPTIRTVKGEFKSGRIPAKYIRAYKTLVGDVSDNIKGIPGFGEKAFEALDKDLFIEMMDTKDPETIEYLNLKPAVKNWMIDHFDDLQILWAITGFFDVDHSLIDAYTVAGANDDAAAEELLKRFML